MKLTAVTAIICPMHDHWPRAGFFNQLGLVGFWLLMVLEETLEKRLVSTSQATIHGPCLCYCFHDVTVRSVTDIQM